MNDNIIVCKRCVMDSTDPLISFDTSGNCNYCNYALATKAERWKNKVKLILIILLMNSNLKLKIKNMIV